MIRVLLGSVLPLLGLGVAVGFVAPSVVATGGEPIIVAGAEPAAFEPAAFAGSPCASTLLYPEGADPAASALRIVALDLQRGTQGVTVRIREVPPGGMLEDAVLVLLVDASGHIIAAGEPASLAAGLVGEAQPEGCDPFPRRTVGAI